MMASQIQSEEPNDPGTVPAGTGSSATTFSDEGGFQVIALS